MEAKTITDGEAREQERLEREKAMAEADTKPEKSAIIRAIWGTITLSLLSVVVGLLSLIIPGLGQLMLGKWRTATTWLVAWIFLLPFCGFGLLMHLYSPIDAILLAKRIRAGTAPEDAFFDFDSLAIDEWANRK